MTEEQDAAYGECVEYLAESNYAESLKNFYSDFERQQEQLRVLSEPLENIAK